MTIPSQEQNIVIQKSNKIPLPMQYLGGKGRIVNEILKSIEDEFSEQKNFIDLFAGSGTVSYKAMMKGYNITANDIQPYSSLILSSLLKYPTDNMSNLIQTLKNITETELFLNDRERYIQDYETEKTYMELYENNNFNWNHYKEFCNSTKLCSGEESDISKLKRNETWTLFLAYYRNTYFGIRQCAEIDFLKELESTLDKNLKIHLAAATVSALTYCVSGTTHLAQYLKPTSEKNTISLLKKKKLSIINEVMERLTSIKNMKRPSNAKVMNCDFRDALKEIKLDKTSILYADPPYFKEHYSRYYHILDTFVLYDYPLLTYNKRLKKTTIGRYREERIISDFGKKSLVHQAFQDLYSSCKRNGHKLAISYASSSLVKYDYFYKLAKEKGLYIKTIKFNLTHSGQGQSRHKQVIEYLFLVSNEKF